MTFSIGGGKAKSSQSSQSQESSYGYSGAQSGDTQRSFSESTGGGSTTQSIAFQDLFKSLYGNASTAAAGAAASAGTLMQHASQLFTGGMDFLSGLGGDVGTDYMKSRLSDTSVLDAQISGLKTDIGDLFTNELNPAITSSAVAGGNLGGGRQGVAQALAIGQSERAFAQGSTALRSADQAQRDSIASTIATNSLQAANTGLGALPSLLDISERGNNAELGIYANLSSILGGPTVLSQSQNFSQSTAQSAADAFSKSFGENMSQGTSSSKGKSSSFNFDIGAGAKS